VSHPPQGTKLETLAVLPDRTGTRHPVRREGLGIPLHPEGLAELVRSSGILGP
jgi:hypothetical protein